MQPNGEIKPVEPPLQSGLPVWESGFGFESGLAAGYQQLGEAKSLQVGLAEFIVDEVAVRQTLKGTAVFSTLHATGGRAEGQQSSDSLTQLLPLWVRERAVFSVNF